MKILDECSGKTSRCIMLTHTLCVCVCVRESLHWVLTAARGESYGQNGLLSFRESIISTFN